MQQKVTPIETVWLPVITKEVKKCCGDISPPDSTISESCSQHLLLPSQLRTFSTMLEATIVLIEMLLCLASMLVNLVIAISIRFVSFYGSKTLITVSTSLASGHNFSLTQHLAI